MKKRNIEIKMCDDVKIYLCNLISEIFYRTIKRKSGVEIKS